MEFKDFSLNIKHTKVKDFIIKLQGGNVMGTMCKICGKKFYPPSADCPKCMSSDMEWFELTSKGKLVTYTAIYVLPEHFAEHLDKAPFSKYTLEPCPVGIVEVENGLRVMGWMPKIKPKDIKVGMTLKIASEKLKDGRVVIIFKTA